MKKSAMLMLCLVLVFALAACAGTDTTPQGSVSDTVTVTDMKGEVAIPANPQRIVDVAGLTEELLILDMKVIASANTSMFDGVSVPKHLTTLFAERGIEVVGNYSGSSSTGDLNLEKIAELKPDLIIMNIRHEKVYEQLAAIAPTVMIDDDISYVNWRGRFKQLGQWFDKEAAVKMACRLRRQSCGACGENQGYDWGRNLCCIGGQFRSFWFLLHLSQRRAG